MTEQQKYFQAVVFVIGICNKLQVPITVRLNEERRIKVDHLLLQGYLPNEYDFAHIVRNMLDHGMFRFNDPEDAEVQLDKLQMWYSENQEVNDEGFVG